MYFLSTQHASSLVKFNEHVRRRRFEHALAFIGLRAPIFVARKLAAPTHRVNYNSSRTTRRVELSVAIDSTGQSSGYFLSIESVQVEKNRRDRYSWNEYTLGQTYPFEYASMEKRFETMFLPSLASALFLIFVTRGRNGLNSPRRILSLSLSRYRETEVVRGEKGESFSREQRTSHMVGWRAGAIIVLACNVRSVGGQEPVSFLVSERACLVETSVRRVMSMTLPRCSCCTHKSSPGTTRASHRYIRACTAETTTINRASTGQPGVSFNTCVPAQVFVHLYVTCLRESTRWIYRELRRPEDPAPYRYLILSYSVFSVSRCTPRAQVKYFFSSFCDEATRWALIIS